MTLDEAKSYLNRLEQYKSKDEQNNKRAYEHARNLSALISIAEHGNERYSEWAVEAIKSI